MVRPSLALCSLGFLMAGALEYLDADPVSDQIERTRLFGNINAFAYYFAELLVGTPPQRVSVIIDTGSGLCGFPCVGCTHCGKHLEKPFDLKASNTSQLVKCAFDCDRCVNDNCGYIEQYTEGSQIVGIWFRDLVMLNGSDSDNRPVLASLGCHMEERKLFYTQKVNGILGLAPHKITGKSNVLQDLYKDKKHVNDAVFSFCLADWGGLWTVGGYDSSYILPGTSLQWVPLHHTGYFGVRLMQLRFGAQIIGSETDFVTTLLDTGTTFTYFPHHVYFGLITALKAACGGLGCGASQLSDESCWKLEAGTRPHQFPNISLLFQNMSGDTSTILWSPEAYMFQRHSAANTWCYAFADNGMSQTTVLGTSFFIHKTLVFDTSQGKLGIAEAACPQNHYRDMQPGPINSDLVVSGFARSAPFTSHATIPTPPLGHIHFLALCLGVAGLLLLLLAIVMCLWAYFTADEEDEADTEDGQLAEEKPLSHPESSQTFKVAVSNRVSPGEIAI